MTSIRIVAALVAASTLVACGADDPERDVEIEPPATDEPADDEAAQDETEPPVADEDEPAAPGDEPERLETDPPGFPYGAAGVSEDLLPAVESAVDDLVSRTNREAKDITVVTAEHVTWPDGSVGCPQPGQMYTQALVEGYRIVLEVHGERHHYHGEDGGDPFLCSDPSDPAAGRDLPTS